MYHQLLEAVKFDPFQQGALNSIPPPPEFKPWMEYYISAFWSLSSCRSIGFGEGPIPWTAVREYGKMLRLGDDDFAELSEVIGALDREYLTIRSEQSKNQS